MRPSTRNSKSYENLCPWDIKEWFQKWLDLYFFLYKTFNNIDFAFHEEMSIFKILAIVKTVCDDLIAFPGPH
jgi:hypothetical protein